MQSNNLAPGESWVQCPYNPSHVIINRKLITHLDRCRKQYEKEEKAKGRTPVLVPCRFNFSHKIPKPEVLMHEKQCQDQYGVIHSMTFGQDAKMEPKPELKPNRPSQLPSKPTEDPAKKSGDEEEEDWDVQCTGGTTSKGYDPSLKLKEGYYLVTTPGLTKSEKKVLREENRKKWVDMQAKAEVASAESFDWDEEQ